MHQRYFDNAATTYCDPKAVAEMTPFLSDSFGNANSIHAYGHRAREAVERARARVAELIGCDPNQIVFLSGATEANNWILRSFEQCAISPFEHASLYEPGQRLGASILGNDGLDIHPPAFPVDLVSVMAINNEIGTIWDAKSLKGKGSYLHSDLTQAVGKHRIDLTGVDFASFSAHKFHGPQGVGALFFANVPPPPMILGGEQEQGLRGGTLNIAGIVGMGVAAAIAGDRLESNLDKVRKCRGAVLDALRGCSDWQVQGGETASPYILSLSFLGVEGEALVVDADHHGFAISSGAACSSRSAQPSHVLAALGLPEIWRRGTVRISFGKQNEPEPAGNLGRVLKESVEKLRKLAQIR